MSKDGRAVRVAANDINVSFVDKIQRVIVGYNTIAGHINAVAAINAVKHFRAILRAAATPAAAGRRIPVLVIVRLAVFSNALASYFGVALLFKLFE